MRRIQVALWISVLIAMVWGGVPVSAAQSEEPDCISFDDDTTVQSDFTVCDDDAARFRTAFERWGVETVGYPISHRYEEGGFITQAFQKAIMQWRPDTERVELVNIFDVLHDAGMDNVLLETRQVPEQLPPDWDGEGATFEEIVQQRQALLEERPALQDAYFASDDPLLFFGLPTSEVVDMGNHYAIRLQRAVLQEWKEDVPWAQAGEVTIANGGDIARELQMLPAAATLPEGAVEPTPQPLEVQVLAAPTPFASAGTVTEEVAATGAATDSEAVDVAESSLAAVEAQPQEPFGLGIIMEKLADAFVTGATWTAAAYIVVGSIFLLRNLLRTIIRLVH